MSDHKIDPTKITKPLQLLAAWLVGLIVIDGSFLTGAAHISNPEWASGALIVAAILNVPIFLFCLFLLQTKFRPEMQEDQYYASYLEKRYSPETAQTELVKITESFPTRPDQSLMATKGFAITSVPGPLALSKSRVCLNSMLPKYEIVKKSIENAGIAIAETFASNKPSIFIISIGADADISMFRKIVELTRPLGLDGVAYAPQDISENQIYVGAYGYRHNPYLPVTHEVFMHLTKSNLQWPELKSLLTGPDTHAPIPD